MLNRNILDKDCVNIRCVKDELLEKDDAVDKKKNRVVNKLNEMKSIQAKGVNSKNVPVKSGSKDDMFEFDDNGGEAADGKANKSEIRYQYEDVIDIEKDKEKTYSSYQKSSAIATVSGSCNYERCDEKDKYEVFVFRQRSAKMENSSEMLQIGNCCQHGIENEKDGQKTFVHCQSLGEMSYEYKARDHERDNKNERYVELRGAYVNQPSTMQTLNSMLKAWNYVNYPKRQYDWSYRRTNNEHLRLGSSV